MIASFIPKHVSNHVLIIVYRFLAAFGVPRFIRRKHLRENRIRLEQANREFWPVPDAYIENQSEWTKIRFGVGRRQSMSYAGCEIIATYNARKALGAPVSKKFMPKLIYLIGIRRFGG